MPELGADAIHKLLAACDEHIPLPVRELDKPFLMVRPKSNSFQKPSSQIVFNISVDVLSP
eukprot:SAG11_NODE_98_length_16927_cov_35.166211_17_plen_60_part_00